MTEKIQILYVEDSESDIRLMQLMLEETILGIRPWYDLHVRRSLADAVEAVKASTYNAILLDMGLPDSQGPNGIRVLQKLVDPSTVIVIITETSDEELALQMVGEGAQDYLTKGALNGSAIKRVISYSIERKRNHALIEHYKNNLERLVEERTAELRQSQELYRILSEASPVGMFRTDVRHICVYVNDRWTEITGYAEQDTLGRPFYQYYLVEDRERIDSSWRTFRADQTGTIFSEESRLRRPDGRIVWLLTQINKIADGSGMVGTISDVTHQKAFVDALMALKRS